MTSSVSVQPDEKSARDRWCSLEADCAPDLYASPDLASPIFAKRDLTSVRAHGERTELTALTARRLRADTDGAGGLVQR